ncbi:TetR/AcrR family transcriptional regulator [Litoribrevibacter albus]|uniref:TetR/AcrR family transcriptional regulator n=1 Tax=Litoribrevibacter albus TaxID=1473156 RepID=UPI0024E052E9|nr:TetR/AcrR family transcriptional regulator [Litoribrevibacter albus]
MKYVLEKLVAEGTITDPKSPKGRLIQAAARLFRDKGYERTTVRDLAAEVGILSGSLFHHFKNKERILRAVMEEAILLNTESMKAALAEASSAEERVLALIKCELKSILGDTGAAMTVLVFEWRSLNEDSQKIILELRDIYEQMWLDALTEAKDEGLVVIDPFILRRLLTGALSWTVNWYDQDGDMDLDELARNALSLAIKS